MKRLLCALLLLVSTISVRAEIVTMQIPGAPPGLTMTVGTGVNALPLTDIRTNPNAVNITTWDDWYTNVPLGFNFPFYGQNFTNSWAATNGYVTFVDPQRSGLGGGCCSGVDLTRTTDPRYNYTIYAMHTDLYSWNGQNQYYLRGNNEMTYGWYNLSQCCSSQGGNSFEIKINSQGVIDTRIAGAMVQWNNVTSGMAGNLANGEYYQYYHGQGMNIAPGSSSIFSWNTNGATGAVDVCSSNPLASPSCPGYQQAFQDQQCSINPLYAPSCPGYAIAYHDQQCNANQLSYTDCPGYAAAYLTQQCTANALYSPSCPGYQQAYFTQQCTASALYSPSCPGYAQAYFTQQCTANALYSPDCPGYAEAYQAQQFAQACRANAQSSPRCPGYVTPTVASTPTTTTTTTTSTTTTTDTTTAAVATPTVVATQTAVVTPTTTTSTTTTSGGIVTSQSTTAPAAAGTVSASGTLSSPTAVPVIADPVVNSVVSNNNQTQTAVTATSAAAQSTSPSSSPASPTSTTTTASTSSSSNSSGSSTNSSGSSTNNSSNTQNTRAALVSTLTRPGGAASMSGGSTGGSSGSSGSAPSQGQVTAAAGAAMRDSDVAGSMEQQKEVQNVVLGAMAYVPGFDVYNVALRDVPFYKPRTIYANQRTVDNRVAARGLFGATDVKHEEMVQQQYKLGN